MKNRIKKYQTPSGPIYPKGFGLWTEEELNKWRDEHPTAIEDLEKANQDQRSRIMMRSYIPQSYIYIDPETGMLSSRYYSGKSEALNLWNPENLAVLGSMNKLGKLGTYLFGALGLYGLTLNAGSLSDSWFGKGNDWLSALTDIIGGETPSPRATIRDNKGQILYLDPEALPYDLGHVGWGLQTAFNSILPAKSAIDTNVALIPAAFARVRKIGTHNGNFIHLPTDPPNRSTATKDLWSKVKPFLRGQYVNIIDKLRTGNKGGENTFLFDPSDPSFPMHYAKMQLEKEANEGTSSAIKILESLEGKSDTQLEQILRNAGYLVQKTVPEEVYNNRIIFDPGTYTMGKTTAPIVFNWQNIPSDRFPGFKGSPWTLNGNTFNLSSDFIKFLSNKGAFEFNKSKTGGSDYFTIDFEKLGIKPPSWKTDRTAATPGFTDTNELARAMYTEYNTGKTTTTPGALRSSKSIIIPADETSKRGIVPILEFKNLLDAGGKRNGFTSTFIVGNNYVR